MDAEPKTATDPDLTFVKVFSSENEDNWIELGIGRLSIVSHSDSFEIIVLPDNDGPALLKCSLATVFGVARPETNIIAWRQSLTSELALSFMDSDQCTKFLNAIQSFQARSGEQPQSEDITANDESDSSSSSNDENMQYEESQSDEHCDDITDENAAVLQERDQTSDTQVSITHSILARQPLHPISTDNSDFKLPLMDLKHLESISICFTRSFFLPGKQTFLANYLLSDDHHNLNRLFELFHLCDDLQDLPSLYCIYTIVRGSLQIHDNDFLNVLLNTEDRVMDVIGALEFNPADSDQEGERFSHRSYLLKNYFLNDVTCIEDVDLLKLIHKTFRLQYITDIMMPPAFIFEDNHLNGLTEYVVKCKTDIVLKMIVSFFIFLHKGKNYEG
ncbi:hypothetical protein GJ496_002318 [Pomphorhynchus laevis]|nr:hypothetical protein GJ496_002318 [Pomphorhynchus laevis]